MKTENQIIIKDIVWAIRRLYRAVYLDSEKIGRQFGLTGSQSGVLRSLFAYGPLSSAEISRKLYVTPSNITGIIDRLEKKGFVKRIPKEGDRRIVLVTLTEKGEELSRALPDPIEQKLISGLVDLEPEQVQNLAREMKKILNLIHAKGAEPTPIDMNQGPNSEVEGE